MRRGLGRWTVAADAAEAGELPSRLDPVGMRRALEVLQRHAGAGASPQASALEPRYYRLTQVVPGRLQPGVPQRVARAAAAGVPAVRSWGERDPAEAGAVMPAGSGDGAASGWWQRVAAAGARPDCILPTLTLRAAAPTGTSRSTAPWTSVTQRATPPATVASWKASSGASRATSTPGRTSVTTPAGSAS